MAVLLVNFGGPRSLEEVEPFLCALLTDRELIRTRLPGWLHRSLFQRIAKRRAQRVRKEYALIGGKSPIYETTETFAEILRRRLDREILTFHRYLPSTHEESLRRIEASLAKEILVFPFFAQFSFATTGSIAALFSQRLSSSALTRLRWVKSYFDHPAFIRTWQAQIRQTLQDRKIAEDEVFLLFSAHGLPLSFIERGDPYERECLSSFRHILRGFPKALGKLAYQSKFGKGRWLEPSTQRVCEEILSFTEQRPAVLIVPFAFTSEHIETLFEIEELYLPILKQSGLKAWRCPTPHLNPSWIAAAIQILEESSLFRNNCLLRRN